MSKRNKIKYDKYKDITNDDLKNVEARRDRKAYHKSLADIDRVNMMDRDSRVITIITMNKGDEDYLTDYAFVKIRLSKSIKARDLGLLLLSKIGELI